MQGYQCSTYPITLEGRRGARHFKRNEDIVGTHAEGPKRISRVVTDGNTKRTTLVGIQQRVRQRSTKPKRFVNDQYDGDPGIRVGPCSRPSTNRYICHCSVQVRERRDGADITRKRQRNKVDTKTACIGVVVNLNSGFGAFVRNGTRRVVVIHARHTC